MGGVQSLYTVASALCLFSSGIVGAKIARVGQPISCFSIYLALESFHFLLELLIAHPATPLKALWLGLLMSTSLLIAPCLWLAIDECVAGTRPALSSISGWQRAVIVSGLVLTVPLIQTMHFGTGYTDPHRLEPTLLEPLIHPTMLMCLALFVVQVPFYLSRCWRTMLESHHASGRHEGAAAGMLERGWLQIPLVIVGTTWLLGVARTITGALSAWTEEFGAVVALIDVSVTTGAVYLLVRRIACQSPLHGRLNDAPCAQAARPVLSQSKYARSPLDPTVRARIVRKLEAAFAGREIHRDCGLTLGSLSHHIHETEHYVSQVINQELGTTFYDLVNRHRIEHAKRLLLGSPDRSVLDVAVTVGFNAKSTFNSAFRRHTGMTPREFRSSSSAEPHSR